MLSKPTIMQALALRWLNLPYFRYQKRIIRKIFLNRPMVLPVQGAKLECIIGDYISDHLLASGIYEPCSIALAKTLVSEGDVFVDVGANIGLYSVLLPLKTKCRSIAFEPNHSTFETLRRNVALNDLGQSVTTIPCALSDKAGVVEIFMDRPDNIGGASMIQRGSRVNISPTLTLAGVLADLGIEYVKLLKIDVEGAEQLVLSGSDLGQVEHVIVEWFGEDNRSPTKEFINSSLYINFFSEFDVFDVNNRPSTEVEFFNESNIYLKRKGYLQRYN